MKKTIYLSGGMKCGWQDRISGELKIWGWKIYDPRLSGHKDPQHYTQWDLESVKDSGCVLAYIDSTNPSGYGLALEVGYAKGLGIPVYFVNNLCEGDDRCSSFQIINQSADLLFDSLRDALRYLSTK